jgi:hypothetical protein
MSVAPVLLLPGPALRARGARVAAASDPARTVGGSRRRLRSVAPARIGRAEMDSEIADMRTGSGQVPGAQDRALTGRRMAAGGRS